MIFYIKTTRRRSIFKRTDELHNDLPFLNERIKIVKKGNLVANLRDEKEYLIHPVHLKQVINHGFVVENVKRVTKVNQKV